MRQGAESTPFGMDISFSNTFQTPEEVIEETVIEEQEIAEDDDDDKVVDTPPVEPEPEPEQSDDDYDGMTGAAILAKSYISEGLLPDDYAVVDNLSAKQLKDDLYNHIMQQALEDADQQLRDSGRDEQVLQYAEYIAKGGNLEDLQVHKTYESLANFDISTAENQSMIVKAMLQDQGTKPAYINKLVDAMEIDGELETQAEEAKKYFDSRKEEYFSQLQEYQDNLAAERQKQLEQEANNYRKIIRKGVIGDNKLSAIEQKEFEKSYLEPTEVVVQTNPDGSKTKVKVTKFQKRLLDIQNDPEKTLELAYIILKGLDTVKTKVTEEAREEFLNILDGRKKFETVSTNRKPVVRKFEPSGAESRLL